MKLPELVDLRPRFRGMRPSRRTWIKHLALLLVAFFTCSLAGTIRPFGFLSPVEFIDAAPDAGLIEVLLALPLGYFYLIQASVYLLFTNPIVYTHALKFSISFLFILICHESGHYVLCRLYGVNATLPYFIPTPPMIGPAGTLGAFIRIISPMPSRKSVFDIGIAGPIAGFIALIPISIFAFTTYEYAPDMPLLPGDLDITFSDPLFNEFMAMLFGIDLTIPAMPNPFYSAAWLGLLVTALNLIPAGQLDGGHAIYAVFGSKAHKLVGRISFVVMAILSGLGIYIYGSPSGVLFTIILLIMLRARHPNPPDYSPLDSKRLLLAFITFLIFLLCFTPFPVHLN